MDTHENARTTPRSRQLIVTRLAEGWTVRAVAAALGIDPKTVRKWRDRFAAEGTTGLANRSSRPHTYIAVRYITMQSGMSGRHKYKNSVVIRNRTGYRRKRIYQSYSKI
ncbi:helix-turn-helix domain-containing protein [Methylobacterium crusticola]|uniref:helix-turn-helix domain-containing protein n=1 Tax=Methylobacterium crusticola TaxID=1697972 RepID=UPI001396992B